MKGVKIEEKEMYLQMIKLLGYKIIKMKKKEKRNVLNK